MEPRHGHHRRRGRRCRRPPEKAAYVLDFRPPNPEDRHPEHRENDYLQLVGKDYFTLMEALPKPGVEVPVGSRIDLQGPYSVIRECSVVLIDYDELSPYAQQKLEEIIPEIVKSKERVFVEFFNRAQPINIRFHSLELLPGVGKKTLFKILEERERKPFQSFEDIRNRVKLDPVRAITERILKELRGEERYYLFVNPPPKARHRRDTIQLNVLRFLYRLVGAEGEAPASEQKSASSVDAEGAGEAGHEA